MRALMSFTSAWLLAMLRSRPSISASRSRLRVARWAFTATTAGTYGWVWRTGMTVNGYRYRRLSAGESVSVATPGAASTSTLFGVVSSKSTNYSYVTCTNPG